MIYSISVIMVAKCTNKLTWLKKYYPHYACQMIWANILWENNRHTKADMIVSCEYMATHFCCIFNNCVLMCASHKNRVFIVSAVHGTCVISDKNIMSSRYISIPCRDTVFLIWHCGCQACMCCECNTMYITLLACFSHVDILTCISPM